MTHCSQFFNAFAFAGRTPLLHFAFSGTQVHMPPRLRFTTTQPAWVALLHHFGSELTNKKLFLFA